MSTTDYKSLPRGYNNQGIAATTQLAHKALKLKRDKIAAARKKRNLSPYSCFVCARRLTNTEAAKAAGKTLKDCLCEEHQ